MNKKIVLIPIILVCTMFLLHDANNSPLTRDWMLFVVLELCLQILIKEK
jgi:hypothetical protein